VRQLDGRRVSDSYHHGHRYPKSHRNTQADPESHSYAHGRGQHNEHRIPHASAHRHGDSDRDTIAAGYT